MRRAVPNATWGVLRCPNGRRAPGGFTLIELMVTIAVTGIVMTVVMATIVAQQQTLQAINLQTSESNSGWNALYEMERSLHGAGFGVDPRYAFDFSYFRCTSTTSGYESQAVCRDSTTAADGIVFMERNPYYRVDVNGVNGCSNQDGCPTGLAWQVTAVSASAPSITITAQAGNYFYYGQVLELVCPQAETYTMVTVSANTPVSSAGSVTLPIYQAVSGNPYFENNLSPTCMTTAIAYQIDRYYYFIETYNNVPWLMLDTGLDLDKNNADPYNAQDSGDLLPIAPYVEDMQIAYIMNANSGQTAPDSNKNWIAGDDNTITQTEAPYPDPPEPTYETGSTDPSRGTLDPANITGVRISLDIRSAQPLLGQPKYWVGDPWPQMENEQAKGSTAAVLGYYKRQRLDTSVAVYNVQSAGMFSF